MIENVTSHSANAQRVRWPVSDPISTGIQPEVRRHGKSQAKQQISKAL
jgi:hypothetical protein